MSGLIHGVGHQLVTVDEVAAWMRVSPDRVHRWTQKGRRALIPYLKEGGRKAFNLQKVEAHIRRKCFCPAAGVASAFPDAELAAQVEYQPGIKLLWTAEFLIWSGLTKAQLDKRVRLGEMPHFSFGGLRMWDPALIIEARELRTIQPRGRI